MIKRKNSFVISVGGGVLHQMDGKVLLKVCI